MSQLVQSGGTFSPACTHCAMEEEIGGEEGGDEEEGWVMGPNILPMERGGEERGGEDEEVGTDEEEAEPPGQHTRFGPRWANFVRNLIE